MLVYRYMIFSVYPATKLWADVLTGRIASRALFIVIAHSSHYRAQYNIINLLAATLCLRSSFLVRIFSM